MEKFDEWKVHILLTVNLCVRGEKPGHSLQYFNTHDNLGKFYIFVRKVTNTGR